MVNIGQVLDIVIVALLLIGVIRGWIVGLAVKVGHVIALVAACLSAHLAGTVLGEMVGNTLVLPLIFGLVLVIALLLFNHVVMLLKIVDRIPVVGTLNKFGGALLGLVTEFIILYIICSAVFTLVPQKSLNQIGLTEGIIRETRVLQFFIFHGNSN